MSLFVLGLSLVMATKSEVEPFKLALCQVKVTADKDENIATASKAVREAAGNGANMVRHDFLDLLFLLLFIFCLRILSSPLFA